MCEYLIYGFSIALWFHFWEFWEFCILIAGTKDGRVYVFYLFLFFYWK